MGCRMTLQLFGTATLCVGLGRGSDRSVVRLRSVESRPIQTSSDFALVRTSEEFQFAKAANWKGIFFIGEEIGEGLLKPEDDARIISVGSQFNYLSDGDILGVRHASK